MMVRVIWYVYVETARKITVIEIIVVLLTAQFVNLHGEADQQGDEVVISGIAISKRFGAGHCQFPQGSLGNSTHLLHRVNIDDCPGIRYSQRLLSIYLITSILDRVILTE